ncbi:MAG: molybdopterin-dependent oxidoreductase [Firmicutes bacterium]|jgi:hypothetical protein|nr:molybdopterin-dependent oxidoreductase [Bacillota bacterium]MDH7495289.1 molybdopterin-dependent oxidoreductase [Bacillota bacterium]
MRRTLVLFVIMCVVACIAPVTLAQTAKPTGKVVVTVTGDIAVKNSDAGLEFDMAMLEGLGLTKCEVKDPWLGKKVYEGVLISAILRHAGAADTADEVVVVAKDGKKVTVKAADVAKYPIILATKDGGKAIGTGLGGPVKLVFPYDTHPEVEKAYDKNAWNWYVVTLEVKAKP